MTDLQWYATDGLAALHPDGWADITPTEVDPAILTPTQTHLVIDRVKHFLAGGEPETGDPYPHVVEADGIFHVHDGHHRWLLHLCTGTPMLARVVDRHGNKT